MGGASCGFVLFKTINSLNVCLCAGRDYVWGTGKVGVKCEGKWVKLALVTDWNEVCCRPFEACNGRRCIYYFWCPSTLPWQRGHSDLKERASVLLTGRANIE